MGDTVGARLLACADAVLCALGAHPAWATALTRDTRARVRGADDVLALQLEHRLRECVRACRSTGAQRSAAAGDARALLVVVCCCARALSIASPAHALRLDAAVAAAAQHAANAGTSASASAASGGGERAARTTLRVRDGALMTGSLVYIAAVASQCGLAAFDALRVAPAVGAPALDRRAVLLVLSVAVGALALRVAGVGRGAGDGRLHSQVVLLGAVASFAIALVPKAVVFGRLRGALTSHWILRAVTGSLVRAIDAKTGAFGANSLALAAAGAALASFAWRRWRSVHDSGDAASHAVASDNAAAVADAALAAAVERALRELASSLARALPVDRGEREREGDLSAVGARARL